MAGFRREKPKQAAIKMAIYGSAGKGKTFTSLLIAEGIAKATGKRVAFVDTEEGTSFYRMRVPEREIHPDPFDIDVLNTRSIAEVTRAVKDLDPDEYCCIVIDSMTHLWESAKNSYSGNTTRAGTIPMHAWGKIKAPMKNLETWLLNSKFHVFILGREGVDYQDDEETGELRAVGYKMKAESETPYEPHILIRMDAKRPKGGKGRDIVVAHVEKDRTGVLAGRTVEWPGFSNIAAPILKLLGHDQAQIPTSDETRVTDVEAIDEEDAERQRISEELRDDVKAQFQLAKTVDDVEKVSKSLTKDVKAKLVSAHLTELREAYRAAIKKAERRAEGPHVEPEPSPPTTPETTLSDEEKELVEVRLEKINGLLDDYAEFASLTSGEALEQAEAEVGASQIFWDLECCKVAEKWVRGEIKKAKSKARAS